ncbi:hypothetical protein [Pseudoalteromonas spongiae]|uniref:hypothetical protein n=1 Tax=Pseudoalteromonas spongiae TaxID=298657 RepID=UPI00026CA39F|nr:hypothetical protein [Pseudoalteromonas spongiae]
MNIGIALISVITGALICSPLFKYMYKAVVTNAPDFDSGYKEVKNRDATDDFIHANGSKDQTVNTFVAYNLVVLMLPLVPSCFIAVPLYFFFSWLYAFISV